MIHEDYHLVYVMSRDNYLWNKDLTENSFAALPIWEQAESFQVLSVLSKSADYGFKGSRLGLPSLRRETLSKNAMLPGLT